MVASVKCVNSVGICISRSGEISRDSNTIMLERLAQAKDPSLG